MNNIFLLQPGQWCVFNDTHREKQFFTQFSTRIY